MLDQDGNTNTVYAHGNSVSLMELVQGNDVLESAIVAELDGKEQGVITLADNNASGGWLGGLAISSGGFNRTG